MEAERKDNASGNGTENSADPPAREETLPPPQSKLRDLRPEKDPMGARNSLAGASDQL